MAGSTAAGSYNKLQLGGVGEDKKVESNLGFDEACNNLVPAHELMPGFSASAGMKSCAVLCREYRIMIVCGRDVQITYRINDLCRLVAWVL